MWESILKAVVVAVVTKAAEEIAKQIQD